jgi:histo-blood group ABO system transferase
MEFSDFVSKQSVSVADDLANNIIAKWHDESHLNRYAAYNKVMILGPQYCYDGKVELSSKKPLVIAVEK